MGNKNIIGWLLCILLSSSSWGALLLGPKNYNGAQPTARVYTESILLSQTETLLNYKIKIKNADGLNHPIKTCTGNFFQQLVCQLGNLPNALYVQFIRVQSFELRNNGVVVISKTQMNQNVASFEATLKLNATNNLSLSILGFPLSYVTLEIEKPATPADTVAPLIGYNVKPNSMINVAQSRIIITDQSTTTTTVLNNGQVVLTSASKSIDYVLPEGVNNLIIRSVDAFGNKSADYIVSQVMVDTKLALVSSDLQSLYQVSQLPYLKTLTFKSNEALQSLQINNFDLIQTGLNTYTYLLQFDAAGIKNLSLKATDLAGNETVLALTTELRVDQTSPVLTLNQIPAITASSSFLIELSVVDDSATETEILVSSQSVLKTNLKAITYTLNFSAYEKKDVQIVSIDSAGNKTMRSFSITRDTKPLYVNIISPQNQSVLNSTLIEVRARANKPLSSARINGRLAQVGADQISVKANIQQLGDGSYPITVEVVDVSGVAAQYTVRVEVKTSVLPSWTYEECPVGE